ncbi:MAG TPA: hypothetical protein DF383_13070, partial [Deltaproteobacteria bacterium]|nr:hypothetical protein [Deltaproteobacteria bacterium]
PAYLERVFPNGQFRYASQAWEAYYQRGEHARDLKIDFEKRGAVTRHSYAFDDSTAKRKVESFIFKQLDVDPERSRALLIEWEFSQLNDALFEAARRQGKSAEFLGELGNYLEASFTGNNDSVLRRVQTGLKAVDVLRRSLDHLAPEEFREIFPLLRKTIAEAGSAVPSSHHRLAKYFDQARTTADRAFVCKVGESPPPYYSRKDSRLPSTNVGPPSAYGKYAKLRSKVGSERSNVAILSRVDSPAYLPEDVSHLSYKMDVMPSRFPHLIAAASQAHSDLAPIVHERMTGERLMAWVQTEEGKAFMASRGAAFRDTFRNRLREGGPGLVAGLAGMPLYEHLADGVGLDQYLHPHERFMFTTTLGHWTAKATAAVNEVLMNRSLSVPFDFVTTRYVSAGSGAALQYGFEVRSWGVQALGASLVRNFGLRGSPLQIAKNIAVGTVKLPFRAGLGMGPGLAASAIADRTVGQFFEEGSLGRKAVQFGSFFTPEIYRIAVGNKGPALFRSGIARFAGRAFSVGYLADLSFSLGQRIYHGAEASGFNNLVYRRANELHNEDRGVISKAVNWGFGLVAPSLAAWWGSVDYDGSPNEYQGQARQELQNFSQSTSENVQSTLRQELLFGKSDEALKPEFYRRIDWSSLRSGQAKELGGFTLSNGRTVALKPVMERLNRPSVAERNLDPQGAADYLQKEMFENQISAADAKGMVEAISRHFMKSELAQLTQLEISGNPLNKIFDSQAALRLGKEADLLKYLNLGSESELLKARQMTLAYKCLEADYTQKSAEAESYRRLAREIGLLDERDQFLDQEIGLMAQAQFDEMLSRRDAARTAAAKELLNV